MVVLMFTIFGIYCFSIHVIWISNTFIKTLHNRRCLWTSNWKIPTRNVTDGINWVGTEPHQYLQEKSYRGYQINISSYPSSHYIFPKTLSTTLPFTTPFSSLSPCQSSPHHLLFAASCLNLDLKTEVVDCEFCSHTIPLLYLLK